MKIPDCISYEKINFILREESAIRARDPALFFDTHYPIKLYEESTRQIINEMELHEKILNAKGVKGTRIFLIKGNPGTGKSEFCWFFKLKAEESKVNRKIIHIPKSEVEPGKVARILSQAIGFKGFNQQTYQGKWNVLRENPDSVAKEIFYKIVNEKVGSPSEKDFGLKLKEAESIILDYLIRWLKYQINLAQSDTRPLAEHLIETFDKIGLKSKLEEKGITDIDIDRFELEFHRKIVDFLSLPSIEDILLSISEKFKQERPIIIIEDLVGIGAARTIILNALSDLARMDIDLIAGVIPAMEEPVKRAIMKGIEEIEQASRELETETLVQRSYDYSLTTETGESTFLNSRESVIAFVKPYLKHIRKRECTEKGCNFYRKCKELFANLFPFNEEFIWRIFQILSAQKMPKGDPRALIKTLRKILEESKKRKTGVWNVATTAFSKPFTFNFEIEEMREFANFISWYGRIDYEKNQIFVPKELLNVFGIKHPSILPEKDGNFILTYLDASGISKETIEIPKKATKEVPKLSKRKIEERNFTRQWLRGEKGVPLAALRHGLAIFLRDILRKPTLLVDKTIEKYKTAIVWGRRYQNEDIPIVFEDEEKPPHPHIFVNRKEIHDVSFLLTDLGVADSSEERKAILQKIKDQYPHIIPLFQMKIEECRTKFKKYLEHEMAVKSLEEWLISSYVLCKMLLLGETDIKNVLVADDKYVELIDKPNWLFPEFFRRVHDMTHIKDCYNVLSNLIENIGVANRSRIFSLLDKGKILDLLSATRLPEKTNFELTPKRHRVSLWALISIMNRAARDLKEAEKSKALFEKAQKIIENACEISDFVKFITNEKNLRATIEKLKVICEGLKDPSTTYELRNIIETLDPSSNDLKQILDDLMQVLSKCEEIKELSNPKDVFELNSIFNKNYWLSRNRTYSLILKLSKILTENQPSEKWESSKEVISLTELTNLQKILELIKHEEDG